MIRVNRFQLIVVGAWRKQKGGRRLCDPAALLSQVPSTARGAAYP
jgi:hypothetical protein